MNTNGSWTASRRARVTLHA